MRLLYHFWLSPFSRKVRIVLLEKGLDCELRAERFWERRHEFLLLNPAGEVPVLVDDDGTTVASSRQVSITGTDPAVAPASGTITAGGGVLPRGPLARCGAAMGSGVAGTGGG